MTNDQRPHLAKMGPAMPDDGSQPGDISAETVRAALTTHHIGRTVYYWPSVGSTNDELRQLAEAGAPEGTLAIADEQAAGRGRLDRRWLAPARSSLLMSLLFRPASLDAAQAQQLTMLCSLAAADAVAVVTGLRPTLKWPNDLVLYGRKLAGLLTDLGFSDNNDPRLAWAVVGMGLNVNVDFAGMCRSRSDWADLATTAISLSAALGQPVSRLALLVRFLSEVETRYQALLAGKSPLPEWAAHLATLGHSVTASAPHGIYHGRAEEVDETGALWLRLADGRRVRILAGDVTLREA
jgi:BirA family transcriptional regulator, biotin operon repressor / biotin---[acetyl-CoA-carboxylase] ligase